MSKILFVVIIMMAGSSWALDLSLEDAVNIALENNRDIQIQKKDVEIAEGEVTAQEGVFDPILNIGSFYRDGEAPTTSTFIPGGTVNQNDFNSEASIAGNLPTGTYYDILNFSMTRTDTDSPIQDLSPSVSTDLSFTIGQELLRNFGMDINRTFIITAKRSSEISDKELEKRVSDTLLEVESRYWLVVAAAKNLELEEKGLELAVDLQNRNEIQVEVGVLPRVSVTQAKSEVAAREVNVIRAENLLQGTEDNLKNILAMDLDIPISTTSKPTTQVVNTNEEEALQEAYEQRPEMTQVQLSIDNKETLKKYYSNQRLPRFALEGSIQLQGLGGDENPDRLGFGGEPEPIPPQFLGEGEAFSQLLGADFPTWQILGVFSYPLFNRTARGQYVKASADVQRSVIVMSRTKDDIALEVKSAIREIENSLRRITAARVSVDLAKEVVENEQERLNVGIGTTREVLEAQRDLIDAGVQLITAVTSYNIALAELERAKGTLLTKKGVTIEDPAERNK